MDDFNFKNLSQREEKGIENVLDGQKRVLEGGEVKTKDDGTTEEQREVMEDYDKHLKREGLAAATRRNYLRHFSRFLRFCGKEVDEVVREDLEEYIDEIQEGLSTGTVNQSKAALRRFFKWFKDFEGEKGHPPIVSWIKIKHENNGYKRPENMPSLEEMKKMIKRAEGARDKCILAVGYESGARCSELTSLRVKDVEVNGDSVNLHIPKGKTGARSILLVSSLPYITSWLNEHPYSDRGESPLFISTASNYHGDALGPSTISRIVKDAAKKAGVRTYQEDGEEKSKVSPHGLRHLRATVLASKLTESQLREYFGWSATSTQPARYVHLSGRDTNKAIRKIHGLEEEEEDKEEELEVKTCPRCEEKNEVTNRYCKKCGSPLEDTDTRERREAFHELVDKILKDEKVQERIRENDEIKKIAREVA